MKWTSGRVNKWADVKTRLLSCPSVRPSVHSSTSRGFSLIEIVLYIAMVGVVLVVAAMFATDFFSSNAKVQALEEASRNARYAADRIAAEVRSAATINQGASVFGANPGTLSIGSSVPLNDPTVFTVSGGALMVSQGGAPAEPITSGRVSITDLTFEDLTVFGRTRLVRIRVTAASRNAGGLAEVNASATV